MQYCENCSLEHDGRFASGRFCSRKCSAAFSTKKKRASINQQLSNIAEKKRRLFEVSCLQCDRSILCSVKRPRKFCSSSCAKKFQANLPQTKAKLSERMREVAIRRYASGDETIGWQNRNKFSQSGPEREAEKYLALTNWKYEKEYKVGKYFLDFAFVDKKIDLEIDGRQHEQPSVKRKDEARDCYLEALGWKIVRVKQDQIAYVVQMVEHVLGKDEVAGSLPAVGSISHGT